MKSILIGIAAVSVYAVSSVALSAPVLASRNQGTNDCLDETRRSSFVTTLERGKGTISTKDGKPLCNDVTLAVASYNVPDSWDRKGWNKTAIPQTLHDSEEFTIPKGKTNFTKTLTINAPEACKHTQMDFYWAPAYADITTMTSDEERNISGVLFEATADSCEVVIEDTPEPETPVEVKPVVVVPVDEAPVIVTAPIEQPAKGDQELVTEMPKTGAASIAGVFGLVSSLGAAGHYIVRRFSRR